MRSLRWLIVAPALFLSFAGPAHAEPVTEGFTDGQLDTAVTVEYNGSPVTSSGTVRYTNQYANQYGTTGWSLFIGNGTGDIVITFPGEGPSGFSFVSGAKNGNQQATVTYADGTTESFLILDDCSTGCTRTQTFDGDGPIESLTIPLGWDIWLLDTLEFDDGPPPSTTSTVGETTTTEAETTTTSSSSTTTTTTTVVVKTPAEQQEETRKEEQRQEYEKQTECEKVQHAYESCPLWPGRTSTTTVTTLPPQTTLPPTTLETTLPPPSQESTNPPTVPTTQRPPVSTQVSRPVQTSLPIPATGTTVPQAPASSQPPAAPVDVPTTQPPTPTPDPTPPPAPSTPSAQVTEIVASVATLTADEAGDVFEELVVEELSEEQIAEVTAAVQTAPPKVRKQFETKVDVFRGGFDDYVPLDSKIPVGERRTLVAVGAVTMVAGAASRMRR